MTDPAASPSSTASSDATRPHVASRATWISTAAQLACLLEAAAPKPGNVSPGRHFADARYADFLASAAAIGPSLAQAEHGRIGSTIRAAVEATSSWTSSNTNLGIVLLLAPLAHAANVAPLESSAPLRIAPGPLRATLRGLLAETTVEDAGDVYAAIRLASPGGLGRTSSQDVAGEPTSSLHEVMRLAAERDGIAAEYASGFAVTFEEAVPALRAALDTGLSWEDAVVEAFLLVLSAHPDSHIARRAGTDVAVEVSRRASAVLAAGGVRTSEGRHTIEAMDREMRSDRNTRNPGTTADVIAAAVFVALLDGGWHRQDARSSGRR